MKKPDYRLNVPPNGTNSWFLQGWEDGKHDFDAEFEDRLGILLFATPIDQANEYRCGYERGIKEEFEKERLGDGTVHPAFRMWRDKLLDTGQHWRDDPELGNKAREALSRRRAEAAGIDHKEEEE